MKNIRFLTFAFAMLMAFSVLSFSAFAEGETTTTTKESETSTTTTKPSETTNPTDPSGVKTFGDWKYKQLTEKTVEIVAYTGNTKECVVPSVIEEMSVTALASGIVKNNSVILSVTIPSTVSSLQSDSFMGCMALKTINITKGNLKTFDIEYCPSLEVINLPETVTSIGRLEQCTMLQKINIDAKNTVLKSVDGVAYTADMKTLIKYPAGKITARFVVPSTVTAFSDFAFSETGTNIKEMYIPSTVTKMGASTFTGSMVSLLLQADKTPDGCKDAVAGMAIKYNQVNIFAPKKVISNQNNTTIKLTWQAVEGADGYSLYYKTANGWNLLGNTTKTSVTFTNRKPGSRYLFALKSLVLTADKKILASEDYITHEASTAPAATTKIASAKNDSQIKLAWEKVSGADGYAIYYRDSRGWNHYTNVVGNSILISNLKAYTVYNLAVRSLVKTQDKLIAGGYREISVRTNLGTPKITAKQTATKEVKLTWTPSVGASHYQVFYKINDSQWYLLSTQKEVKILSFSNTGLQKGMKITLAVQSARVEGGKVVARSGYTPVNIVLK